MWPPRPPACPQVTPPATKKIEHNGVKVELLGQIEGYYDRGNFYDFLTLTRELAAPGELAEALTLPFEFRGVEMQYESYHGLNVRLRYMLRVTVTRAYGGTVVKEFPFWVVSASKPPEINNPIKMEASREGGGGRGEERERGRDVGEGTVRLWPSTRPPKRRRGGGGVGVGFLHRCIEFLTCPSSPPPSGGHRGLPPHRVRVRQVKVPPQGLRARKNILPARANQGAGGGRARKNVLYTMHVVGTSRGPFPENACSAGVDLFGEWRYLEKMCVLLVRF